MNMKKKILSLVLAVAMCASMSTSVFASDADTAEQYSQEALDSYEVAYNQVS